MSSPSTDTDRFWDRMARYADGRLEESEVHQFELQLRGDQAALEKFVLYMELHARIAWDIRARVEVETGQQIDIDARSIAPVYVAGRLQSVATFLTRPTPLSIGIAAVFVGLMIATMAFVAAPIYRQFAHSDGGSSHRPQDVVIAAKLTGLHDATWAKGQIGGHLGAHLLAGHRVNLISGLAEITYDNGTTVLLEGPAKYTVDSKKAGTLSVGKLSASVTPEGKGFEIHTPAARVVDLGTSFGLAVEQRGRSHVYVFAGAVEVRAENAHQGEHYYGRLTRGQALTVDPTGSAKFAKAIARDDFMQKLPLRDVAVSRARVAGEYRIFDSDGDGDADNCTDARAWTETGVGETNDNVPNRGNGKYWIAFELPKQVQQGAVVESAFVRFTLARARNVDGFYVQLVGVPDCSTAEASEADFQRAGVPLGRVFEAHSRAHSPRTFDVSNFVQSEAAQGRRFVVFCLQTPEQALPNSDNLVNCFLIFNDSAPKPQLRPTLLIRHQSPKDHK